MKIGRHHSKKFQEDWNFFFQIEYLLSRIEWIDKSKRINQNRKFFGIALHTWPYCGTYRLQRNLSASCFWLVWLSVYAVQYYSALSFRNTRDYCDILLALEKSTYVKHQITCIRVGSYCQFSVITSIKHVHTICACKSMCGKR